MKKIIVPAMRALAISAKKTAVLGGRATSLWGPYQPVVPKKLQK